MSVTIYGQDEGWWGIMRAGSDDDTRAKSFAADLSRIKDTIASVSAVNITRQDGASLTANDLSLSQQPIISTVPAYLDTGGVVPAGMLVTLWLRAGTADGVYQVELVVLTTGGRTLGRDTFIKVSTLVP